MTERITDFSEVVRVLYWAHHPESRSEKGSTRWFHEQLIESGLPWAFRTVQNWRTKKRLPERVEPRVREVVAELAKEAKETQWLLQHASTTERLATIGLLDRLL